ncbi:hypothetical protein EJ377_06830 [Chryseobacterium arthrosphaerae]|uniref:Uncharacterized protein n=1 Tax=Chryseobacterium arthrosphaerae TaxID=651561 RepID=A0A3S0N5Y4_9FLAO|nr:hypothetical protein EJ377_06830 [Chryseobacterium arthrosphaerae]
MFTFNPKIFCNAIVRNIHSFIGLPFSFLIYIGLETLEWFNAIIFIVVVTELNDVFQYLMGKFFGKRKITPI